VDNDSVFCSTCGERIADDAKSTGESSVPEQLPIPNLIENNSSKKTNDIISFIKKINVWAIVGFILSVILILNFIFNRDTVTRSAQLWILFTLVTIIPNSIGIKKAFATDSGKWFAIVGLILSIIYCVGTILYVTL
jgi:hypothetical protein